MGMLHNRGGYDPSKGVFIVSVPGVNTVILHFQVSLWPVSQVCTQWLFYPRYFHSQCPRSEHSDCSIPGIFTACVPGVYTLPVLFQVFLQSVSQECTQWLASSQSVSQECTQWLFYSRYFHSQCPRSEHSDCSIPGIFTTSVPGMYTVIVPYQVFSQPVSQECTQWLFYSRYFQSQCPRSEHSDCSILGIFTVSIPGVNIVTVLFQASSQPVSQEWTQWLFYSGHLHSQCPRGEHSQRSIPGIFTASVTGVNTVIVLFQVFSQSVSQECTEW